MSMLPIFNRFPLHLWRYILVSFVRIIVIRTIVIESPRTEPMGFRIETLKFSIQSYISSACGWVELKDKYLSSTWISSMISPSSRMMNYWCALEGHHPSLWMYNFYAHQSRGAKDNQVSSWLEGSRFGADRGLIVYVVEFRRKEVRAMLQSWRMWTNMQWDYRSASSLGN